MWQSSILKGCGCMQFRILFPFILDIQPSHFELLIYRRRFEVTKMKLLSGKWILIEGFTDWAGFYGLISEPRGTMIITQKLFWLDIRTLTRRNLRLALGTVSILVKFTTSVTLMLIFRIWSEIKKPFHKR